jgi:hypothetical protein
MLVINFKDGSYLGEGNYLTYKVDEAILFGSLEELHMTSLFQKDFLDSVDPWWTIHLVTLVDQGVV